ncbi:uncharacterized protein F5Z01DRAFT_376023 [Emericellopsis atlantica]|uniref:Uncharacterized protein n=1 Tax=Emericellopsis atlantica TaxID=2614577 RepID=A0A9P7ZEH3_9HYPO|nr:uncharacterized protein F5Z01DRAFT_376023 [Emericellopsis atlantica]KAG9250312.1 hypothetical protein F5Z01DRAFT_376023 [Emericellopsis atlantica]
MALNHTNWTAIGKFQSFSPLATAGLFFVVLAIRPFFPKKSKTASLILSHLDHRRLLRASWVISLSFVSQLLSFFLAFHPQRLNCPGSRSSAVCDPNPTRHTGQAVARHAHLPARLSTCLALSNRRSL